MTQLPCEFEFLVHCCKNSENLKLKKLYEKKEFSWNKFLELVSFHRETPLVWERLKISHLRKVNSLTLEEFIRKLDSTI